MLENLKPAVKVIEKDRQEQAQERSRIRRQEARDNKKIVWHRLDYDAAQDCYIMHIDHKLMQDLPEDGLHITEMKGHYMTHSLKDWEPDGPNYGLRSPGTGMSAIDMDLWLENNKLRDAIMTESKVSNIDWKKLLTYAVVGIVAIYVIMAFIK